MALLDDNVAIITGSARGIGRETATLPAAHGARVVINDLDADLAHQTADEIDGACRAVAPHLREPAKREAADGEEVAENTMRTGGMSS